MTLLGQWVVDKSDRHTLEKLGDVVLQFDETGGLTYIVRRDGKQQTILMSYEVNGNIITTDQLSAPRVERTVFSISENSLLTLSFGGEPVTFRRICI